MDTSQFFEFYYNNAQVNCILIMDSNGMILDVNQAFVNNFGYDKELIKGKNFEILFTNSDKQKRKPMLEIENVLANGQSHDENYILDNNGKAIWCTGESMLAIGKDEKMYIIKDIINLQAKKQLQLFLKNTDEFLERVFESSKDVPMMILDGSIKIQKVNNAFLELFEIETLPEKGSRLVDLHHPFWNKDEVKFMMRDILMDDKAYLHNEFFLDTKSGKQKTIKLFSKIIEHQSSVGRQIFIIFEDITSEIK